MIISVTNQKGGVGKTTMLSSLAALLTQRGYKVLCVNLDPQRNLDMFAGCAIGLNDVTTLSTLHIMQGRCAISEAIVSTPIGDLVRASSQLSSWQGRPIIEEAEFNMWQNDPIFLRDTLAERFEEKRRSPDTNVLRDALTTVNDKYDYILLDTNPSLMLLTMNALYAADYVLVPVFTDDFSRSAVGELWNTIQSINYYDRTHKITVAGLVVTKSSRRTRVANQYYRAFEHTARQMDTILFDTKIRQSVAASEATAVKQTIISYAPKDEVTKDYERLADEFIVRIRTLEAEKNG